MRRKGDSAVPCDSCGGELPGLAAAWVQWRFNADDAVVEPGSTGLSRRRGFARIANRKSRPSTTAALLRTSRAPTALRPASSCAAWQGARRRFGLGNAGQDRPTLEARTRYIATPCRARRSGGSRKLAWCWRAEVRAPDDLPRRGAAYTSRPGRRTRRRNSASSPRVLSCSVRTVQYLAADVVVQARDRRSGAREGLRDATNAAGIAAARMVNVHGGPRGRRGRAGGITNRRCSGGVGAGSRAHRLMGGTRRSRAGVRAVAGDLLMAKIGSARDLVRRWKRATFDVLPPPTMTAGEALTHRIRGMTSSGDLGPH